MTRPRSLCVHDNTLTTTTHAAAAAVHVAEQRQRCRGVVLNVESHIYWKCQRVEEEEPGEDSHVSIKRASESRAERSSSSSGSSSSGVISTQIEVCWFICLKANQLRKCEKIGHHVTCLLTFGKSSLPKKLRVLKEEEFEIVSVVVVYI
ncbi:Hypothetical predicted protein [Scomber scombrus]|uniref:Uncharacterized protein n=1 Tax=Scomber scombrus TaxID=13677 RepID=A0AAV1Q864_SCOSC